MVGLPRFEYLSVLSNTVTKKIKRGVYHFNEVFLLSKRKLTGQGGTRGLEASYLTLVFCEVLIIFHNQEILN